jgi:hypothetical protein
MNYTFTYKIEKDDYYQFNRFHIRHSAFAKRRQLTMRFLIPGIFIAAAALFYLPSRAQGDFPVISVAYLALAVLFGVFFNQISDFAIKRNIKKMQRSGRIHYDKDINYEFGDELFRETTPDSTAEIKYSIITEVAEGKKAIYIYVNLQQAHIVPLRVFASEQERGEFLRFIKSKIAEYKTN